MKDSVSWSHNWSRNENMVGAGTDASIPYMAIIYINYSKHPALNNVTAVLLLLKSIKFLRRRMSFSLPNHDYLA